MLNNILGFRGNPKLKRPGTQITFTPEMIEEYIHCRDDVFYFIENYYKIVTEDGVVPMKLRTYQKSFITAMRDDRFVIGVMSRQCGKTEAVRAFMLHYILFNDFKTIGIAADKEKTANEIIGKLQLSYQHLPLWLQLGVEEKNKGSFVLENGSRILAEATGPNSFVGFTIHILYIDEAAKIEKWDEFYASVRPTISAGKETKLIMTSTPKGLNHFYEFYEGCSIRNDTNGFTGFFVTWDMVPGRDEIWKETELKSLKYNYELFNTEYNCAFLGSSGTLIAGWRLQNLMNEIEIPLNILDDGVLRIYKHPVKGKIEQKGMKDIKLPDNQYVITADVSRGKDLDYSAFSVIDVTSTPYQQVCTYRNNKINPSDYSQVLHKVAGFYNNAVVLVEINDIGEQVGTLLIDEYGYDNVLCTKGAGRAGKQITWAGNGVDKGIRTTTPVKNSGCLLLKLLVEQKQLLVIDKDTIDELNTFSKNKMSYEAEKGRYDDLVMSLVLFAWLSDQKYFKELTDINTMTSLSQRSSEQIENELSPFGYISSQTLKARDANPWNEVLNMNLPWNPFRPVPEEFPTLTLPNF